MREGGLTQESTSDGIALYKAYAECRSIARREAKNFYYAFIALPTQRRNAICAIYAFMRKADDLAETMRRVGLKNVSFRRLALGAVALHVGEVA